MSELRINDMKYKLHPKYNLFGASEDGTVISIVTMLPPKRHEKSGDIIVKGRETKMARRCKVIVFIWESHNGIVPVNFVVKRINGEGNHVNNLYLEEKPKTRFSPEERAQRDHACMVKWRNTV